MNTTTREAAVDVLKADSVEDLVPETIDRAVVLQMLGLVVTVPIAAEVVVVATTEDLVEVAMEVSTVMMDMEEIITPRQLTGGAIEFVPKSSFHIANMETTCNLARLYCVASRTCSTLPAVILLKIHESSESQEIKQHPVALFKVDVKNFVIGLTLFLLGCIYNL